MPAEEVKSESAKKNEDWMNSKWRPAMGWMYMMVCIADFVFFPVLWSLVQVIAGGEVKSQWSPITLQGAGLFHMAMGAILGIAAYGRTQEKLNGANNGGIAPPAPAPSFGAPASSTPAFGAPATPTPAFGAPVAKPASAPAPAPAFGAPVQPPHPEI
jgi:hypothetical protein